jgi:hypothetical protein
MALRSRTLLAAGLVLLTVPLWAPVADVTGPDHVYRTAPVTVDGDGLRMDSTGYVGGPTDQVACLSSRATVEFDRGCFLEATLRDGNATVRYPAVGSFSGSPTVEAPRYVVFGTSGPVYRRTLRYDAGTNAFELGLSRVEPEAALAEASLDGDRARPAVRRALRTGQVRTDAPLGLGDGRLYAYDGGYAVVYEAGERTFLSAEPLLERLLEAATVALGALAVYRAGRRASG